MPKRARSTYSVFESNTDRDNAFKTLEALLQASDQDDDRTTFTPDELTHHVVQTIGDDQKRTGAVRCIEGLFNRKHGYNNLLALATTNMHVPRAQELVAQWMHDHIISSMTTERTYKMLKCTTSGSIVRTLLADSHIDSTVISYELIHNAIYNDLPGVIEVLIDDGHIEPTHNDNFITRCAVLHGRTKIVRLMLNDGRVDPTARDNTAIKCAVVHGHPEIVQLLLDDGRADPATRNNFDIHWADKHGYTEIVRMLLADARVYNTLSPKRLIDYRQRFGTGDAVE